MSTLILEKEMKNPPMLTALDNDLLAAKQDLDRLVVARSTAKSQQKEIAHQVGDLGVQLEHAQDRLDELRKDLKKVVRQMRSMERRIDSGKRKIEALGNEVEKSAREFAAVEEFYRSLLDGYRDHGWVPPEFRRNRNGDWDLQPREGTL